MPIQFAIVHEPTDEQLPEGAKPIHVECGEELEETDQPGVWMCLHCLKTGYLLSNA